MGLTVHSSEFAELEVEISSSWRKVPGVSGYTESGGEAPERDVVAFDGVAKRSGLPRVPTIEMTAIYAPAHDVWRKIRAAALANTIYRYRLTTKAEDVIPTTTSGVTAAVAVTTGIVTFVGDISRDQLAPGMILSIGAVDSVLDVVPQTGDIIARKLGGAFGDAISASVYSISIPSLQRGPFAASIRIAGNVSLESEGDLTTTLSLSPRGQLPEWTIQ